jgi:hypothetical protein
MTNEIQIEERVGETLLDINVTKEILNRSREFLELGTDMEKIAHKLAGDALSKKGNYLKALPHYEKFGEVPEQTIHDSQILYLGLVNEPKYLDIFRGLVSKYGRKFSNQGVNDGFVKVLQNNHSCFLTGPANVRNKKTLVEVIERETGVRFDRALVRKAYIEAMEGGYGHCVENVFANSNHEKFKPRTIEEFELINKFYEQNITSDSLASPNYVHSLPMITGVSPIYKLLLNVGREKADRVKRGKLNKDYLKEFVESTGMPCLGKYLYMRAGMKRETYKNSIVPLPKFKKPRILKRICSILTGALK